MGSTPASKSSLGVSNGLDQSRDCEGKPSWYGEAPTAHRPVCPSEKCSPHPENHCSYWKLAPEEWPRHTFAIRCSSTLNPIKSRRSLTARKAILLKNGIASDFVRALGWRITP